jgi:hypothetical protein
MMVNNDGYNFDPWYFLLRRYILVIIGLLLKFGSTNSNKCLTN